MAVYNDIRKTMSGIYSFLKKKFEGNKKPQTLRDLYNKYYTAKMKGELGDQRAYADKIIEIKKQK